MKFLALDLGNTMGWAFREDAHIHTSGIWDLTRKIHIHLGHKYVSLWNCLESFRHFRGAPDHLIYERPGRLFGNAKKSIPGLQAIIEFWGLTNDCEIHCFAPNEVKKHATGKGKADKVMMMAAARRTWPDIHFEAHDQGDAMWLLDFFLHTQGYNELAAQRPGFKI